MAKANEQTNGRTGVNFRFLPESKDIRGTHKKHNIKKKIYDSLIRFQLHICTLKLTIAMDNSEPTIEPRNQDDNASNYIYCISVLQWNL